MGQPEVAAEVTATCPPIGEMEPFFFWVSPHAAIYPKLAEDLTPAACQCARQAFFEMEVVNSLGEHWVRPS